ncbi:proteasome maturation protein [Ptiloglossa arizonensis]|uniref:proteasome maturation protein n=1 Tax=Ptiloglossa arizonensis TaxID=3350558 RepID=UPI003FA1452A
MSFGLPSVVPKPTVIEKFNVCNDNYGISSPMVSGLSTSKQSINNLHPLEATERNYQKNRDRMNMILLRNTQGIHAPMRIAMELKACESIGRLPFLPSSNMMRDVLLGRDEEIGFEDVLNISEFREEMGQPHAIIEKSLGIL